MFPLLGHGPSLWITHTGYNPPHAAKCDSELTTANADGIKILADEARRILT
jgi:hypothetical protein